MGDGRRIGRFIVTGELIRGADDDMLGKLWVGVVPVTLHDDVFRDRVEYLAVSRQFDPVPEGSDIPTYICEVSETDRGLGCEVSVRWRRVAATPHRLAPAPHRLAPAP